MFIAFSTRMLCAWTLGAAFLLSSAPVRSEPEYGSLQLLVSNTETSPVPTGFTPGFGVLSFQNRYAAQKDSFYVVPGFIYIGENFMYLGDRARYYLHRDSQFTVFAFGRVRGGNLNPEKNAAFEGMHRRTWEAEAGVGGNIITPYGLFTFRASSDVTGTSKGQEMLAWVDFPLVFERFLVMPGMGMIWRSSRLANYYFGGIGSDETAPDRPAWNTGATLSPMASIITTYRLSRHWIGTVSAGYEWYDKRIANSPIVQHRGEAFLIAALGYVW
jgi:outer membrane protein